MSTKMQGAIRPDGAVHINSENETKLSPADPSEFLEMTRKLIQIQIKERDDLYSAIAHRLQDAPNIQNLAISLYTQETQTFKPVFNRGSDLPDDLYCLVNKDSILHTIIVKDPTNMNDRMKHLQFKSLYSQEVVGYDPYKNPACGSD